MHNSNKTEFVSFQLQKLVY